MGSGGLLLVLFLCCSGAWAQNSGAQTECSLSVNDRADVLLLLDGFNSISLENFSKVRDFLKGLVTFLGLVGPDTVQISLVQFGEVPHTEFYFNTHHNLSSMVSAVTQLSQTLPHHRGSIRNAVDYVLDNIFQTDHGARADVPHVLIFISDRNSSGVMISYRDMALKLQDADVKIFAVGVKDTDRSKFNVTVTDPEGIHLYTVEDFNDFSKILKELTQSLCLWLKQKLGLEQPRSLRFSEVRSRSARASWEISSTDVMGFILRIKPTPGPDSEHRMMPIIGHTQAEIQHLLPQTSYTVRVYTVYSTGCSLPETGVLTTLEDSVRLTDGPSRCSGFLEVQVDQSWTSVCGEDFGRTEAELVCRELDCGVVSDLQGALFTEGSALGRSFHCDGVEVALKDCESSETHCSSAVNLTCTDDVVQLQPNPCLGYPKLRHQDQWRPVRTVDPKPDLDFWSVVCDQVGCGSALGVQPDPGVGPFWWVDPQCVTQRSSLKDCLVQDPHLDPDKDWGLTVICSGFLPVFRISVSSDGVSQSRVQRALVRLGADFIVSCSFDKKYIEDIFHLLSPTGNYTLPAVNNSAHFLFSAFSPAHIGNYTCVLPISAVLPKNSAVSETVYISPGVPHSHLILRAGIHVLILLICTTALYFICKAIRGHRRGQL